MIYNRSLNVIEKVHDLFRVFSVLAHIRILSKWTDTTSRASLCGTLGWNIFLGLLGFSTSSLGDVPSPSARSWSSVHLLLLSLLYLAVSNCFLKTIEKFMIKSWSCSSVFLRNATQNVLRSSQGMWGGSMKKEIVFFLQEKTPIWCRYQLQVDKEAYTFVRV